MTQEFKLSPSSLNLFIAEPALWVLKHFYGLRTEMNIYGARGRLVEHVLNQWFLHKNAPELSDVRSHFINELFFIGNEISPETLNDLYEWGLKCIAVAEELKMDSEKPCMQTEIDYEIEGIKLTGFLDYEYPNHVVDLKTTNKLPIIVSKGERKGMLSKTKAANIRQQVIYQYATGKESTLLYIDQQGEYINYKITQKDVDESFPVIIEAIRSIKKLLTFNADSIIKEVHPKNTKSFYWDDATRKLADKLWS